MKKNNLFKRYFLLLSGAPILFNFLIVFVVMVAFFIFTLSTALPSWTWIFLATIGAHTLLVCFISSKYITRDDNLLSDGYDVMFKVLILKNGKKIIFEKPFWGKGKMYYIKHPASFQNDIKTLTVCTEVQGKHKNSTLHIPVSIKIIFNDAFNKLEIFDVLRKSQPKKNELSLDEYVIDVFKKMNINNQGVINKNVEKHANLYISEPVLLNKISQVLIFPNKLFSNIKNIKIYLGSPTFFSCKELTNGG